MKLLQQKSIQFALLGIAVALGAHVFEIAQNNLWQNLHVTADDVSYYRPAFNWWEHGVWKDNTEGASSFVQRPPLMGIIHLMGYLVLGSYHSWFVFATALVLHGWGIACFYRMVRQLGNEKWAKIGTIGFIVLPCFWGFLSYNITEAFVISTCLLTARFALLETSQQLQKVLICLLLLYLFRPVLVVLFVPAFIYLVFKHRKRIQLNLFLKRHFVFLNVAVLILIGVFTFWEIRKTNYTGEVLNPHPIYHSTNNTQFRPPHQSMTELFKIWETRPEVFHNFLGRCSFPKNDPSAISFREVVDYCTERNVPLAGDELFSILQDYGQLPKLHEDKAFCTHVDKLTRKLKSEHKFQYYVQTPLIGMKEQLFKSQLNLTIFQETYHGNFLVEGLRYLCLGIILLSYLSILIILFLKVSTEVRLLAIGGIGYGIVLFWIQRMNEDRYLLPLMALGFLLLTLIFASMRRKTR